MRIAGRNDEHGNEAGFTLLEVMVSILLIMIGILGLTALFTVVTIQNSGQGNQATRTTEYAQDKMEQLMTLSFNDSTSNLTTYPTCVQNISTGTCTGTGLGGNMDGSTTAKGGLNTASPVTGYYDYLDASSSVLSSSAGASYIRQWQVKADGLTPAQIKTITVQVTAISTPGAALLPQTTLVSQKANY